MNLQEENKKLKARLKHAQTWMQKEVSQNKNPPNSSHIEEKIYGFFPPEVLSHFPQNGIQNIISSELIFEHILTGEDIDGMGVILGYQKLIDEMIELYITKGFRKFAKKHIQILHPQNTPLEKSLHLVITKKYILSLGRIYGILQEIKKSETSTPYITCFLEYLKSRPFLHKCLLESHFLLQLQSLIDLQAITDKRHSGRLSQHDTLKAREIITGNFENKDCILSLLAHSQVAEI